MGSGSLAGCATAARAALRGSAVAPLSLPPPSPHPCLRNSGEGAADGRREHRGSPLGSGSLAGCATAARAALREALAQSRHSLHHRSRFFFCLRGSGGGAVDGLASLAAWHRLRIASPEVVQRLGWRNSGPAPEFTPVHQLLHRVGEKVTRVATISARRHGCAIRARFKAPANT